MNLALVEVVRSSSTVTVNHRDIKRIAQYIDHTILKPNISEKDVARIVTETEDYGFASACIPPSLLSFAKSLESKAALCTVISFPFGYQESNIKLEECKEAIKNGADELDLVVNAIMVKSNKWLHIKDEMKSINDYIHSEGKIVKWIFENSFLDKDEILRLCDLCNETKPDFAKTSTGFGEYGARLEDVVLMRKSLSKDIAIKASGGIRSLEDALKYVSIGATRIGSSSGVKIINEAKSIE